MRLEKCERRPAAFDLRFEVRLAAHALAVADAGFVDAKQNKGRFGRKPLQELVDPRRRPLGLSTESQLSQGTNRIAGRRPVDLSGRVRMARCSGPFGLRMAV